MGVKRHVLLALVLSASACREDVDLGGGPPSACAAPCSSFVDRTVAARLGTPSDWFWGERTELARPEIVYPLAGSIHPVNFEELTLQWKRLDRGQTLFRLRFFAPNLKRTYDAYVPCLATGGEGCRYQLPDPFFAGLRRELAGEEVELTVEATDGAGGPVTKSNPLHFRFTGKPLENKGFYYWAAPGSTGVREALTLRLAVGARRPDPYIQPQTTTNPFECGGCHVVSRDGSEIAFTARTSDEYASSRKAGQLVVAQTDELKPIIIADPADVTKYDSSMLALNEDGSRVLVSLAGRLEIRYVHDSPAPPRHDPGFVIGRYDDFQGKHAFFPEFSPGDDRVVVTLSDDTDLPVKTGAIATLNYDKALDTLSNLVVLLETPDEFHFYPTWSPDEKYIAFVSAPRDGVNASSNQKNARLRLLRLEDRRLFELENATQGVGNWSTLPKFAPFLSGDHDGRMFLTFTSKIDYGLLLRNTIHPADGRLPQLWMTAIDASLPIDPSSAPVWLPFQSFVDRSHFGYWTEKVVCREGVTDSMDAPVPPCGPGEKCVSGVCIYQPR